VLQRNYGVTQYDVITYSTVLQRNTGSVTRNPQSLGQRSWSGRKLARIDYRQAGWLHAPGKSKRALDWRSLENPRISRNCRNLQNTNSAAAEIAIRYRPKILLKCARLNTNSTLEWIQSCKGIVRGRESRCQKSNDYRSVSLSLFLPPSPLFVLLTSLRSAQANTHAFIFCLSQIFIQQSSHPYFFISVG
jgi:hypothetical protein